MPHPKASQFGANRAEETFGGHAAPGADRVGLNTEPALALAAVFTPVFIPVVTPALNARKPQFSRHASLGDITAAVLQCCLDQVNGNASAVAAGSVDAEHIHQLRVGLRRLRTALRALGPLSEGIDPAWDGPLAAVSRRLGHHRDQSQLALCLNSCVEAAGGPMLDTRLNADAPAAADGTHTPAEAVRSHAFQQALRGIASCALALQRELVAADGQHQHQHQHDQRKQAKRQLLGLLNRLHTQTLAAGKKFPTLDLARQHQARKRLKQLRYLAEFLAPLFSARRVDAFVAGLKPAQDALGQYHDELVALEAYRRVAPADPRAWFGVGWLTARQGMHVRLCQKELQAAAQRKPFWH